jgi:predicted lactoylglutathione lyase
MNEVFFAVYPNRDDSEKPSEIVLLDELGELVWEKELDQQFYFNGKQYSGFNPHLTGFKNEVLISVAFHHRNFPALVSFWNSRDGEPVDHYWHPGFLYDHHFSDTDGDGLEELLLSGINNPGDGRGHAALCALNVPPEVKNTDNPGIFNPMGSLESRYFLFPAPASQLEVEAGTSAFMQQSENRKLVVDVRTKGCTVFYTFSPRLELESVDFSDSCNETHTQLHHEGRINHEWDLEINSLTRVLEFSSAPNGNSPELERLFREAPNCSDTEEKPCLQKVL